MPFVVQDGSPFELEDGSNLLVQGESGVTPISPASATASAHALTPAAVLPAAAATAAAGPLFPAAVIPAASATAQAFAPSAFPPVPVASATAGATAPLVPPVIPSAAATASAHALLPAVLIPPAAASATAFGLTSKLPLPFASATASAGGLFPAALIPPASASAAAHALIPPALPIGVASATASAHAVRPAVLIPVARATARARMLTPPAGSALNPGYPLGSVDERIELLLDGTWTNITTAALPNGANSATIKNGQPDGAQQPAPAGMSAVWDNPDYSLSPRNSSGPYFGMLRQNTPARVSVASPYGTYLRLENDDSDLASVADTSALHVTGSLEMRLEARLSDWSGCTLAARNDGATASWSWLVDSGGTLSFFWFDSGGTLRHVTSDAAPAVTWKAFRVTMLATTGTVTFYVSDSIDGTWTQLGSALSGTSGAATTVRAGNSPLVVGWSAAGGTQLRGQVKGFRLYSGIGGTRVADAAFSLQVPGVTTWTDYAGLTWNLSGGAEITARDYRLHSELSTLAPTADVSGSVPRVSTTLAGRLRRLQQGRQPAVESPMRRAVLAQAATVGVVGYWTMEDALAARSFGPSVGSSLITETLGLVKPAADSSFEASAALPTLNGDSLSFTVDTYTGGTAWALRFAFKEGSSLPASNARLFEVNTTGACTKLQVFVEPAGTLAFKGLLSGGSTAFSLTGQSFPQLSGPALWSIEATPSGGNVLYALVAVAPGASVGNAASFTVTGHGSFGNVTGGTVNADLLLTDTVLGHLWLQKTWDSLFDLGQPLNAWRGELAADRFARVCSEQGIAWRIMGRPVTSQAMGPQPRGNTWAVLQDCGATELGLLYEPRDCFGLGFRTFESLGVQAAGVTLSFASANLRGDLQPADDDSQLVNDVLATMPDGTQFRVTLDDGSPKSVSEPKDGGSGRYAGSPPQPFNLASSGSLGFMAGRYLALHTVDEQRYRNVVMDLGIPGAPYADIARLRPGDLIKITDVPGIYQTDDIEALAMFATEALGPGRRITCDTVPQSPYSA